MNKHYLQSVVLASVLSLAQFPGLATAGPVSDEADIHREPSGGAMAVDALLVRPLMVATTVVGSALFLISLPFSALGGNVDGAAHSLVVEPAQSAFQRPLGEYE